MVPQRFKGMIVVMAIAASAPLYAAYEGPSDLPSITTAKGVAHAHEGGRVVLEGHIRKHLKKDRYEFEDGTGKVEIEVDSNRWPAAEAIKELTRVRLNGEVERESGRRLVDVKQIEVIR